MTSPGIKISILVALAAAIYLFVTETRRNRRTARLIECVQANYPATWNGLPWGARKINRLGGLIHLYRNGIVTDPRFVAEYRTVRRFRYDQVAAVVVAAGALVVVYLGLAYWGWRW